MECADWWTAAGVRREPERGLEEKETGLRVGDLGLNTRSLKT